jgi:DNA helicase-2/ATP-dependent DNA helicase PcrA
MQAIIECEPSRFLDEIPQNLVEYHEPQKEVPEEVAKDIFANMLKKFSAK